MNYSGRGAVRVGRLTYDYVDQRGVDGLVNGIATVTGESGGAVRRVQTGRLQFYALILVLAVGLFALVVVDLHVSGGDISSMNGFESWALTLTILIPGVAALVVMLIPRAEEEAHQVGHAPRRALATFGVMIGIALRLQLRPHEQAAVRRRQGVDRRSSTAATTSRSTGSRSRCSCCRAFITVLCVVYSWNHFPEPHNPKAFLALILILEVGMNGTFIAQDLILFFVFFEVVLLPMFFMIGVWGGPNREYASIKFFLFTLFGSALMLLGFLALYFKVDVLPAVPGAQHSFDMVLLTRAAGAGLVHSTQLLIFAGDVPRLRDQGADVPVPHLAPRRAHRGADGRLGAAGRDPAEARRLRVHPHRACRCSPKRPRAGRRGSAGSR